MPPPYTFIFLLKFPQSQKQIGGHGKGRGVAVVQCPQVVANSQGRRRLLVPVVSSAQPGCWQETRKTREDGSVIGAAMVTWSFSSYQA